MQKSLEVRTPLVQNGADEHGPDRGDITVEWAQIGRLNGDIGKLQTAHLPRPVPKHPHSSPKEMGLIRRPFHCPQGLCQISELSARSCGVNMSFCRSRTA